MRLRDLAGARIGYGYRRLHVLLRREGGVVNHKRVYRLYCEEGLAMRKRPPRRHKSAQKRELPVVASRKNECWSMDFMSDALYDGRRFRLLTLVDNHTRESLALHVGQRLRGYDVVRVLEQVVEEHGRPQAIRVDNGPEFISKELDLRAYFQKVRLDFSRPGKPTDNALIEAFEQPLSAGVPERALVPVAGGCEGEGGRLASGVQSGAAAQCAGERAAGGVRRTA